MARNGRANERQARANEPKGHHTVPRFLLERFADSNGVIDLLDRETFKLRATTGVRGVLKINHFYRVETEDGPSTIVEKFFANDVERHAAEAIRRIVDQQRALSFPRPRTYISRFLATQFLRGTSMREALRQQYIHLSRKSFELTTPEMIMSVMEAQGDSIGKVEAEDLARWARNPKNYQIQVDRLHNEHARLILEQSWEFVPYFRERSWQLLTFEEPTLVTGDEPIALVGETLIPGDSVGLGNAPAIVFPTDPRHALVLARRDVDMGEKRRKGTPAMARIINEHIAFACHRSIIRHPCTDPLNGITLPRKAPPVTTHGKILAFHPCRREFAQRLL